MERASANGVIIEKVIEKVTRQPVYKRKDEFAEITQKLSKFVETNKLKITQLKFTQRSGTLCFKMPGQEKENPGGGGSSYGSDDSSSGGLSRRKRRECREAQRNNSNKNSASSDLSSSSGYSTENIKHATDIEGLKESKKIEDDLVVNKPRVEKQKDNLGARVQELKVIKELTSIKSQISGSRSADRTQAGQAPASSAEPRGPGVVTHSGMPKIQDGHMSRSARGKIVKKKSIDPAQASKKTSGPGNLAHYSELLKEAQVKLRFEMQRIEEENKKNLKKETKINKHQGFSRDIWCPYCTRFQEPKAHYCKELGLYVTYDKTNKIVIKAQTEEGA